MLAETPFAVLIAGIVLVGLYLANTVLDHGVPQYVSRKIGHAAGGVAYLLAAFLFSSWVWPVLISGSFTFLLLGARGVRPNTFRGVGGSTRAHAWAELWFPLVGTLLLAIGWAWLGDPWLAVVPILYMAWGDCVTGLVRSQVYGREVKGNWGTVGMIATCLLVAYLFNPYWIAACGAGAATLAERFTPPSRGFWDDNWTIMVASLLTMGLERWFF